MEFQTNPRGVEARAGERLTQLGIPFQTNPRGVEANSAVEITINELDNGDATARSELSASVSKLD